MNQAGRERRERPITALQRRMQILTEAVCSHGSALTEHAADIRELRDRIVSMEETQRKAHRLFRALLQHLQNQGFAHKAGLVDAAVEQAMAEQFGPHAQKG